MVDQALVQTKINYGFGKTATALGQLCTIYRANAQAASVPPLSAQYEIGTINARFTTDPMSKSLKPAPANNGLVYAALDRTTLEDGDYLVDANINVWFIASIQALLATPAIRCNRAFTVQRPEPSTGPTAYGGNAPGNLQPILTAWPGFITSKSRGVQPEERVPGDTRLNLVTIMLPVTAGAQILPNDLLTNDQADPQRYTVSLATATDWGWTVDAYYAGA